MRILTATELHAMPAGVVYSQWVPCMASDLLVKGESYATFDWLERLLLPSPSYGAVEPDALSENGWSRWGMHDPTLTFCLYALEDLTALAVIIDQAKEVINMA